MTDPDKFDKYLLISATVLGETFPCDASLALMKRVVAEYPISLEMRIRVVNILLNSDYDFKIESTKNWIRKCSKFYVLNAYRAAANAIISNWLVEMIGILRGLKKHNISSERLDDFLGKIVKVLCGGEKVFNASHIKMLADEYNSYNESKIEMSRY